MSLDETSQALGEEPEEDASMLLCHANKISDLKKKIFDQAEGNITEAQRKYKAHYDKKHSDNRVSQSYMYHAKAFFLFFIYLFRNSLKGSWYW